MKAALVAWSWNWLVGHLCKRLCYGRVRLKAVMSLKLFIVHVQCSAHQEWGEFLQGIMGCKALCSQHLQTRQGKACSFLIINQLYFNFWNHLKISSSCHWSRDFILRFWKDSCLDYLVLQGDTSNRKSLATDTAFIVNLVSQLRCRTHTYGNMSSVSIINNKTRRWRRDLQLADPGTELVQ